jgi:hypothetical protein
VAEYGLNPDIGPISLATLSGGGLDETGGSFSWGKDQVIPRFWYSHPKIGREVS